MWGCPGLGVHRGDATGKWIWCDGSMRWSCGSVLDGMEGRGERLSRAAPGGASQIETAGRFAVQTCRSSPGIRAVASREGLGSSHSPNGPKRPGDSPQRVSMTWNLAHPLSHERVNTSTFVQSQPLPRRAPIPLHRSRQIPRHSAEPELSG